MGITHLTLIRTITTTKRRQLTTVTADMTRHRWRTMTITRQPRGTRPCLIMTTPQ